MSLQIRCEHGVKHLLLLCASTLLENLYDDQLVCSSQAKVGILGYYLLRLVLSDDL